MLKKPFLFLDAPERCQAALCQGRTHPSMAFSKRLRKSTNLREAASFKFKRLNGFRGWMDWGSPPTCISIPGLWRAFAWRSVPSLKLTSPNQDCKTKSDFRNVDTILWEIHGTLRLVQPSVKPATVPKPKGKTAAKAPAKRPTETEQGPPKKRGK